jgi:ABC-2 type transport system ATP-binding protein
MAVMISSRHKLFPLSIKVENITKQYGSQMALNGVDFEISSGEIVGFLGPNGAGKSTMMKILTCYIPPTSGKAWVCGHDVMDDSMAVRKRVGYLPEHNPLYLDMYVKEYLGFVAGIYKLTNPKKRVAEMIEMVGLGLEQSKPIGALSKGYRQRVGLAQAMIHDPEVLILDEPTSGLDPNQLTEIRNLISTIGRSKTVMLSTHIMQEVEALCNRVIIINRGNIVADKPVAELMKSSVMQQSVVIEFSAAIQVALLKNLPGVSKVETLQTNEYKIYHAAESDLRDALFKLAVEQDLSVRTLRQETNKLEDIFKQLTQL